jgi:hypothetical protein
LDARETVYYSDDNGSVLGKCGIGVFPVPLARKIFQEELEREC